MLQQGCPADSADYGEPEASVHVVTSCRLTEPGLGESSEGGRGSEFGRLLGG